MVNKSSYQLFDNMSLFCLTVILLVGNVAPEVELKFFQSEEATLQCEHGLTAEKLTQIEWKINGKRCAAVKYITGAVDDTIFDCNLQSRAEVARTNLTISPLMISDEGEFRCAVENDYSGKLEEVVTYNVVARVRPRNQHLMFENQQYNHTDEIVVNDIDGTSKITCSVISKPNATFTWTTDPKLSTPLQHAATCNQGEDKVFNCTDTLTLSNKDFPIRVACHIHALGNTTDLSLRLVPLSTTHTATTTALDMSTATSASVPSSTKQIIPTTAVNKLTTTSASVSITVLVKFHNDEFKPGLKTRISNVFVEKATAFCIGIGRVFGEIQQNCSVNEIRNGCVLIDSTVTFDMAALTTLVSADGKKNLNAAIKDKIENSNISPFNNTSVSFASETELTSSATTYSSVKGSSTTPTHETSSKWKNIYIVPICIGTAIVILIVVIISRQYRNRLSQRNNNRQERVHTSQNNSQHVYHTYASIQDVPFKENQGREHGSNENRGVAPNVHHGIRQQQPHARNPGRNYHGRQTGYVGSNNKSHRPTDGRHFSGNMNALDTSNVRVNKQRHRADRSHENIRGRSYDGRHINEMGGPNIGRPAFPYMAKVYHNRYTDRMFSNP